ncbi:Uncharacterised protein [Achromobacter xylosoxidans]|nr:Uncharacterised protein [Achromobacter xylosoxidans]
MGYERAPAAAGTLRGCWGRTRMRRDRLISEQRLRKIYSRQFPLRFGKDYIPAQLATRAEAPRGSRPSTMVAKKLGRELHFMSLAERQVGLLALYNPRLFDLHEQHALNVGPADHPLKGHVSVNDIRLPAFEGTVQVAERLGLLSRHKKLSIAGFGEKAALNRPGFRGGCLVKVKRPHRRMCRVGCSSLPQPQPAGYSRWMSAGVDG